MEYNSDDNNNNILTQYARLGKKVGASFDVLLL